jgi:phenylacetic acid degradation operon negative regulatory protein
MVATDSQTLVDDLIARFRRQQPLRVGSLVITVFGDAVAPRGGAVWLGSLSRLLERFGIRGDHVRTAVARLTDDDWLERRRLGRRSFFHISASGRRRIDDATRRIYAGLPNDWDGCWSLVVLPGGAGDQREILRKELGWQGFGSLAPGVLARPSKSTGGLAATFAEWDDRAVVFDAKCDPEAAGLRQMAEGCWNLDAVAEGYGRLLSQFGPLRQAFRDGTDFDDLACLQIRLLLIHEFRKVILRDPILPPMLLPENWIGFAAHTLCRDVYRAVAAGAERWLDAHTENEDGPLPAPGPEFLERFGGLRL